MHYVRNLHVISLPVWSFLLFVAFSFVANSVARSAANDFWVGKVIYVSEKLTAISPDSSERILKRGSKIYQGDVLQTSERSNVQLRLRDDAVMVLRPETEIRIDTFFYNENDPVQVQPMQTQNEGHTFRGSLLKGSIRIISGNIGKRDSDVYRVNTPVGAISWVKNANYELVLGNGGLAVAVWEGSVMVENYAGSLILGETSDYVYTLISGIMTVPQGSSNPPELALLYKDNSNANEIRTDDANGKENLRHEKSSEGMLMEENQL